MKRFVLDASVSLCWCFENQTTNYTESVFDLLAGGAEAHVPFLWSLEMANVLILAERRKQITPARVTALLEEIGAWSIRIDTAGIHRAFQQILSVARQYSLTAYDAAYLELAIRETLPLATLDDKLGKAAKAVGLGVVSGR